MTDQPEEEGSSAGMTRRSINQKLAALSLSATSLIATSRLALADLQKMEKFEDAGPKVTGHRVARLSHDKTVYTGGIVWSRDGRVIVTTDVADQTLYAWDAETGHRLWRAPKTLNYVGKGYMVVTLDNRYLVTPAAEGDQRRVCFSVFDLASGALLKTVEGPELGQDASPRASGLGLSPDGRYLVAMLGGITHLAIFDNESWSLVHSMSEPDGTPADRFAISPTQPVAFIGNVQMGRLEAWNYLDRKRIAKIQGHPGRISSLACSPDGKFIYSSARVDDSYPSDPQRDAFARTGDGDLIRIWSADTLERVGQLAGHFYHVIQLAMHPSGRILASTDTQNEIRIWSLDRRVIIETIKLDSGVEAWAVSFSPRGDRLAYGDDKSFNIVAIERTN